MITNNCPVCGKAGLKNYKTQHIICPQCNSDLKPYLLLGTISKSNQQKKSKYLPLMLFGLVLITLLGLYLVNSQKSKNKLDKYKADIIVLEDSIIKLNKENSIQITKVAIDEQKNTLLHKYIVKKGDYLWKLAEFFYGDGRLYKQIEKDNNLTEPYTLYVGQEIKINLTVK